MVYFVESNICCNCQGQLIFYITIKISYYNLLGNSKKKKKLNKKGHTTEQCRVFKDHLEQLVKSGHLKEFVVAPKGSAVG